MSQRRNYQHHNQGHHFHSMGSDVGKWVAIGFTLLLNVATLAYSAGALNNRVSTLENEAVSFKAKNEKVDDTLTSIQVTLERIDSKLAFVDRTRVTP